MNGEAKKRAVHERLMELEVAGRLTPDAVVADARDPESPLHDAFEWDDREAADRYRTQQARHLISSHRIYIERREVTIHANAYVRDPRAGDREQGYVSVASLKDDKGRAREALENEAARAAAHLNRVRSLAVALGLEGEVDAIIADVVHLRAKIDRSA